MEIRSLAVRVFPFPFRAGMRIFRLARFLMVISQEKVLSCRLPIPTGTVFHCFPGLCAQDGLARYQDGYWMQGRLVSWQASISVFSSHSLTVMSISMPPCYMHMAEVTRKAFMRTGWVAADMRRCIPLLMQGGSSYADMQSHHFLPSLDTRGCSP